MTLAYPLRRHHPFIHFAYAKVSQSHITASEMWHCLFSFFFLSQSQRNNCPLCWGVRKARKLDFLIFFSWSLELKFLELRSSYHNQVSDRERIFAQANCSMSGFDKAEEVNYVSSATAFLRVRQSKGSCLTMPFFVGIKPSDVLISHLNLPALYRTLPWRNIQVPSWDAIWKMRKCLNMYVWM